MQGDPVNITELILIRSEGIIDINSWQRKPDPGGESL